MLMLLPCVLRGGAQDYLTMPLQLSRFIEMLDLTLGDRAAAL